MEGRGGRRRGSPPPPVEPGSPKHSGPRRPRGGGGGTPQNGPRRPSGPVLREPRGGPRPDPRGDGRHDSRHAGKPRQECAGILEVVSQGWGLLRTAPTWLADPEDVYVGQDQIRRHALRSGQLVGALSVPPNGSQRRASAVEILTVEGQPAETARDLPVFERLTAEAPTYRLPLETPSGPKSTRMVDLMAPVGKGQRGLNIAPPFAGKTRFLTEIAAGIHANHPEVEIFVLLVDERPEEVTAFRRAGVGQVVASSYDAGPENHLRLAELAMERAQRLVEAGKDVAILIDSLTRLTRASNLNGQSSGRTLSGGLDPAAVRFPRKLFGSARTTLEAGSLTILATVLVDTESRMDDLIFQEFKGTGNWEVRLDRSLAEQRLFPAVDVPRSGTRQEELLIPAEELDAIHRLRRSLRQHGGDGSGQLRLMLGWLEQLPTNEALIRAASRLAPRT